MTSALFDVAFVQHPRLGIIDLQASAYHIWWDGFCCVPRDPSMTARRNAGRQTMQLPAALESRDTRYTEARPLLLPSSDISHQSSTTSPCREEGELSRASTIGSAVCHGFLQLRGCVIYKCWLT